MYADLHRHLDGSLRPDTLAELAEAAAVAVPERLRFEAGMGLDEALARFAFTVSLLQDPAAVRRVAAEMCEDAASDGVTTLEIRFAPQLHQGADPAVITDAALDGIAGRAGLILCGLYGEDPSVLRRHVELARSRPGVVGIDLAGGPTPAQRWALADYAEPFRAARELGIGRTVHAGEGRPPAEIRTAVEVLHAQRVGHGTTVLADPSVVELLLERGVVIEACPTSNVHTGVVASVGAHPLPAWIRAGLRACVCTDNTLLSDVRSSEEHGRVSEIGGMDAAALAAVVRTGHEAAFPRR